MVLTLALAACGSSGSGSPSTTPTPTTPTPVQNRAQVISSITVSPSFGVSQVTQFLISASATDPDGDAVTYTWDFGDGTSAQGPSYAKTYGGSGVATVKLTVSDGKGGTASDTRQITVGSASGTWRGVGVQLGTFTMQLQQDGSRVTGSYSDSDGSGQIDPAQPGSIDARGHLDMRIKQGRYTDWNFRGDMDGTGRRITGQIFGSGFNGQAFTMDKQ